MRLTYFGHSCFRVELPGAVLVIDPFLSENPHGPVDPSAVPCDHVLCTHAHQDHICDALALARLHGATVVAPFELANHFAAQGAKTIDLMPGGGLDLPWGRIQMTPAVHSSALELSDGENRAMGVASGYLIKAAGRALYHAGDTALFGDMSLIGRHALDLALIPMGDRYTMGPDDALESLNLLRPRLTVPMHYNTFDAIRTDPAAFARRAVAAGHAARVMAAGESLNLQ
ncbi:MAG TPA: metal-dependent hydrolase [Opitutaceae bacterium]|nr:metal-dependent hydrolase [Opitutaceae bacterium]HRJ47336.1 metal-dependent hydrolase [Opitutaceae bacterium]